MKTEQPFSIINANVVLADEILQRGWVFIENGIIAEIGEKGSFQRKGTPVLDAAGMFLLPGFIDIHSDAIEREIETRPGSFLPVSVAVSELDRKLAASGVTTIFHSLAFADSEAEILRTMEHADRVIRDILAMKPDLLVHTKIHARYEITHTAALDTLEKLASEGCLDMISIMDHTPGQGQFKTPDQFREYYGSHYSNDENEIQRIMAKRKEIRNCTGVSNALAIADLCSRYAIPLASHDDDTADKIEFVAACNAVISEFPVTLEAAALANERNMMVAVGAPNIVRGSSHNNNLSALDLISMGYGSIVCSDYVPSTLVHALFRIVFEGILPLPDAIKLFSTNPANALGLGRGTGTISKGLVADLVLVDTALDYPRIAATFVNGRKVYASCIR